MSATVTSAGYRPSATFAPRAGSFTRRFSLYDWAFAVVIVQTILLNPVIGSAGPLSVYLSALTWPALFAVALVRVGSGRDPALRRACTIVLACTALVAGLIAVQLSVLDIQVYTLSTLPKLAYVPAGIVAALCVYRTADRFLDLVVVALGLKCTFLLVQALQGPIDLLHRIGPRSLGGPNTFGQFIGVIVVLRLSTWILGGKRPGPFVLLSLPPCVAALSLTFSRSALIALGIGLIVLMVLSVARRGVQGGLLAAVVALALGGLLLFQGPVRDRLSSIDSSRSGRDAVLEAAWDGIAASPIIGHGLGSFRFRSPHVIEFSGAGENTTPSAHNIFLQVGYEGGLLGLVAVVCAIVLIVRQCWSSVLAPVCLMLAANGMFELFPYVIQTSWVIGLVLAVGLHHRWAAGKAPAPALPL